MVNHEAPLAADETPANDDTPVGVEVRKIGIDPGARDKRIPSTDTPEHTERF